MNRDWQMSEVNYYKKIEKYMKQKMKLIYYHKD